MAEQTQRADRPWDRLLRRPSWSRALLARRVLAAYRSRGFVLVRRLNRDAWTTLIIRRS